MEILSSDTSGISVTSTARSLEFDVTIEARVRPRVSVPSSKVKELVRDYLVRIDYVTVNEPLIFDTDAELSAVVDKLYAASSRHFDPRDNRTLPCAGDGALSCPIRVYYCSDEEPTRLAIETDGESETIGSQLWVLPSRQMDDLWTSLIFEDTLKTDLLNFIDALMLMSSRGVDPTLISVNRLLLFHGPPGTGKTTLCKALAQRLAIRLHQRYKRAYLVEVNSHSLFSKWFSESGKLVMQLFEQIANLCEDPEALVCVLVDEVESVTMARQLSMNKNEPSDSVRVVNALLTQIDNIRRYTNTLLLTTSNLSEAVDAAFVDRADLKVLIPPLPPTAIYAIYVQAIHELQRVCLVSPSPQLPPVYIEEQISYMNSARRDAVQLLYRTARESYELSGRTLRKLPAIAFARLAMRSNVRVVEYIEMLRECVADERRDRAAIQTARNLDTAIAMEVQRSLTPISSEKENRSKMRLCTK